MNLIFYQTKTQFENTGDALINNAMINILRNYGSLKCNCGKNIPEEFVSELGIKENEKINSRNDFEFVISILKSAIKAKKNKNKIYLFSGLGHQCGGGLKLNLKIILSTIIMLLYSILGVKIVKIGFSIGPLNKSTSLFEKNRSKFIDYYYVRDTKSLNFCKKIGIKKANLCPDLSWCYSSDNISKKLNKSNIVTVNLRGSILNENDEKYQELLLESTKKILEDIQKEIKGLKVLLIYQVKRDREFCLKAYNYLNDFFQCEIIDQQILLKNASNIYSKSSFNISSRLHSLLLGYKYGSLPIAVIDKNKHIKISQTFMDADLENLIYDINNKTSKINDIIINSDYYFKKILQKEINYNNELIKILDYIFKK